MSFSFFLFRDLLDLVERLDQKELLVRRYVQEESTVGHNLLYLLGHKEKAAIFNVRALIRREVMRSKDAQCNSTE